MSIADTVEVDLLIAGSQPCTTPRCTSMITRGQRVYMVAPKRDCNVRTRFLCERCATALLAERAKLITPPKGE